MHGNRFRLKPLVILTVLLLAWIFGPPMLWVGGVVAVVSAEYNGTCPGIMDIPPYPCTLDEYIARNTVSPFALPFHMLVIGGWLTCSVVLAAVVVILYIYVQRRPARGSSNQIPLP